MRLLLALLLTAQVQSKPQPTLDVALTVNGAPYAAKAIGGCIYSASSSIYDAPATQWGAQQRDDAKHVNFTLWRLDKGGDFVSLSIEVAGKTHRVNTLTVGPAAN